MSLDRSRPPRPVGRGVEPRTGARPAPRALGRQIPLDAHRQRPRLHVLERGGSGVAVVLGRRPPGGGELVDRRRRPDSGRAGSSDRVGHAGVEAARAEGREQVRGLAGQQHAPVVVGEPVGDDLEELVGRDPRDAVRVIRGQHLRDPAAHALLVVEVRGVVGRSALQVCAPAARERDEQHVAPFDRGVLVVEDARGWERAVVVLGDVDDHEVVLGPAPRHRDPQGLAHRGPRAVGGDQVRRAHGLGAHRRGS